MAKKTILFVSLSRSDYATLKPILRDFLDDKSFKIDFVAGGSHLLSRFGYSIKEIENDGFKIKSKPRFLSNQDTKDIDLTSAYIKASKAFFNLIKKQSYDYVFLVGDRWEIHAVASVAFMLRIPIIHHSGGDVTEGSADNQIRYSVSNLASIHYTATDLHKKRLENAGEESWRVLASGEPALEELKNLYKEVKKVKHEKKIVLASYHPCSFEKISPKKQIQIFLSSLNKLDEKIIITSPNPDAESKIVFEEIKKFSLLKQNVFFYENLGNKYYEYLLKTKFLIGNSSSGIWEAQTAKVPVINVGPRQNGRTRSTNVIDVQLDKNKILNAISRLKSYGFQNEIKNCPDPYYKKNSTKLILDHFKKYHLEDLLAKKFIDAI